MYTSLMLMKKGQKISKKFLYICVYVHIIILDHLTNFSLTKLLFRQNIFKPKNYVYLISQFYHPSIFMPIAI